MERSRIVAAARSRGAIQVFPPIPTIKCDGPKLFRSQIARDLACLLDVNPAVVSWICLPRALDVADTQHVPDFEASNVGGGRWYLDAPDRTAEVDANALASAATRDGFRYRLVESEELYTGPRLRNAKDLLRYADHNTPLGDRIRLLAVLDEEGALTMAEALQVFQETKGVAGLASMILRQMVEVDLDEELLGPRTVVRRIRR
jgi:hypothetical protein